MLNGGARWNNAGLTYNIDAMGGLLLNGGATIQGGTLSSTTGNVLQTVGVAQQDPVTLSGVTLEANLVVDGENSSISVPDTLTLKGGSTVTVSGPYAGLYFSGTSPALAGSGLVRLGGGDFDTMTATQAGATLSIGSGITIDGVSSPYASYPSFGTTLLGSSSTGLVNQGTIEATGTGQMQVAGSTLFNQGRLEVDSGATIFTSGSFTNPAGGVIEGTGVLDLTAGTSQGVLTNQGTITAGASNGSAGTLTIRGGLNEGPTGTIQVNLGGTTSGIGYSPIAVSGPVNLDGTLSVSQASGFVPNAGDVFTYLDFGSSSGGFASTIFNSPTNHWQLSNSATPTSMSLRSAGVVVPPPPPVIAPPPTTPSAPPTASIVPAPSGVPASASGALQSALSFAQIGLSNTSPGASSALGGPSATTSSVAVNASASRQPGLTGASASIVNFVPSESPALQGTSATSGTFPAALHALSVPPYLYLDSDLSNLYFRVLPLHSMGRGEIGHVLDARNAYMRQLFARANGDLAANPGLAGVPDCKPGQDPASGACLYVPPPHRLPDDRPRVARAVVVGLDDYADPRIPRLIGTVPDATSIGRLLHADMGYRVQLLRNPSKRQLIGALNTLIAHAGPNDSILVYYAGHGDTVDSTGQGYWIPSDADPDDPRGWVSNVDIDRLLQRARSRQIAVISDSCYSGQFVQNRQVVDLRKVPPIATLLRRRAVTVMSSGGDEPVADTGADGHSVFASDLMRSLRAIRGWRNGDSVFRQVRVGVESVLPQSPRYGAVLSAGHQPGADYVFERGSFQEAAR